MNTHLNIFKTYADATTSNYQLENNLTRALAISLQEDTLFFHEVVKFIFNNTPFYNQLFGITNANTIDSSIDIQVNTKQIQEVEHLFAISLSETEMDGFWEQNHPDNYNPICDLVIKLDSIYIIIEVKRDGVDCTSQLYNQVFNILKQCEKIDELDKTIHLQYITPLDLKWSKLMQIAQRVYNIQKTMNTSNRFLTDFIDLIRNHNYSWMPEYPINALKPNNKAEITRRIESAINQACEMMNYSKLNYASRLGIEFNKDWAQELLFNVNDTGGLDITIYPGNTKEQGYALFEHNPSFNKELVIDGNRYEVEKEYHIEFTSFQKYFSGLWFNHNDLRKDNLLYTKENFYKYCGRKKREEWKDIEQLFNDTLLFDWKKQCEWDELMINSGKNQMDVSFGYEFTICIPFSTLKKYDTEQNSLLELKQLIIEIYNQFANNLLVV